MKELVKRLNRVLEDLKSDSEPDAEWIRGTLAENNTKVIKHLVPSIKAGPGLNYILSLKPVFSLDKAVLLILIHSFVRILRMMQSSDIS